MKARRRQGTAYRTNRLVIMVTNVYQSTRYTFLQRGLREQYRASKTWLLEVPGRTAFMSKVARRGKEDCVKPC